MSGSVLKSSKNAANNIAIRREALIRDLGIVENHKNHQDLVLFLNVAPGRRLLLTPGVGMGGKRYEQVFVPPANRIGYNKLLLLVYIIYIHLYTLIFIYIMKKLAKSQNACTLFLMFASWQMI